jgi:hypothetical protein
MLVRVPSSLFLLALAESLEIRTYFLIPPSIPELFGN